MICKDCNHTEHESGKCKQCNCGESEKIVPQGVSVYTPNTIIPRLGNEMTKRNASVVPRRNKRYR
jgi:hypothetical protein